MLTRIQVMIADSDEVVIVGLRVLLGRQSWVERCLVATSADAAVALARHSRPHVAILALTVTDPVVQVCACLRQASPGTHLLLSGPGQGVPATTVAAAGAVGFVSRSWPAEDLIAAIRIAATGMCIDARAHAGHVTLTSREQDVLAEIARGKTNREIARALNLSLHTIKQHASATYRKLDARNRTQAVEHARQLGILV